MDENITNKKPKKIILIVIIFLVFLLIATYAGYAYYKNNIASENLKNELLKTLSNNDLTFFIKNDLLDSIEERLDEENYDNSVDMLVSTTMENNMFSELDLSKFEVLFNTVKDNNKNKSYNRVQTKYSGNDLITFDFIKTQNQFAIKSDEIVNKYVGLDDSNVQTIINKINGTKVDLSAERKIKNFLLDRESIDRSKIQKSNSLSKYASIVKSEVVGKNISKKENIGITMDSEQITATEYTIKFDASQVKSMLENISDEIEEDDDLFGELVVSKVVDFDKDTEDDSIIEYTDNDLAQEIQANEINYEASLQVWNNDEVGVSSTENSLSTTPTDVTQDTTTNTNTETTITPVPVNTTIEEVQTETDTSQSSTETPEPTTDQSSSEITTPSTPQTTTETTTQSTTEVTETEPSDDEDNTTIQEDENLRRQGYIAVNEDDETNEEDDDDSFIIGENFEETSENIYKQIDKIDWKTYLLTGAKANYNQEDLIQEFQKILAKRIKQNNSMIAKLYISDNKFVKIIIETPETSESLDIEIDSKSDTEKYLNITYVLGEEKEASGYEISLYKKTSDSILKNKLNINKISQNKIKKKTSIDMQINGSTNSKKYTANVNVKYSDADGEFKINLSDTLSFETELDVEDLNDENCLFIDTLSDEDLIANVDAIKEKTISVLKEKNRNLNIIDLNNSNLIVQQNEQTEEQTTDNGEGKEEAKQALIEVISNKMREYIDSGNTLTLNDLEGLEVPGYEVNISITSNLAIINVNGYSFKLDSEFNLSD